MKRFGRLPSAAVWLTATAALLTGCRSAWIHTSIVNRQSQPVNLVIVNYPGGTFGVQSIAPHATFHYKFHLLGDGKLTLSFTDAVYHDRKSTGPQVRKGDAGTLTIDIEPGDKVEWEPHLAQLRK